MNHCLSPFDFVPFRTCNCPDRPAISLSAAASPCQRFEPVNPLDWFLSLLSLRGLLAIFVFLSVSVTPLAKFISAVQIPLPLVFQVLSNCSLLFFIEAARISCCGTDFWCATPCPIRHSVHVARLRPNSSQFSLLFLRD